MGQLIIASNLKHFKGDVIARKRIFVVMMDIQKRSYVHQEMHFMRRIAQIVFNTISLLLTKPYFLYGLK